jgi:hypothetical protein
MSFTPPPAASGAPTDAEYLVNSANGTLSAEIDLSATPLAVNRGGTGAATLTGVIKGNGTGAMTAASAGTDYLSPTGSGAGLTGITASQVGAAAATSFIAGAGALTGPAAPLTIGTAAGAATGEFAPAAGSSSITTVGTISSGNVVGGIAAKSLAVSKLADGTDGELITWDAAGVAAVVAAGTATHVLTSNGAGAAPTFQAIPAATVTPQFIYNVNIPATDTIDADQWTVSLTGTGAASFSQGSFYLTTGTTDGSHATALAYWCNDVGPADAVYDLDPEFIWLGSLANSTATPLVAVFTDSQGVANFDEAAACTSEHVGFALDTAVLYASNADGATQTKTDISAGVTATAHNTYRAVFDSGTNIKFYVNGTLKATHTTNLCAGAKAGRCCAIGIDLDAGQTTNRFQTFSAGIIKWNLE